MLQGDAAPIGSVVPEVRRSNSERLPNVERLRLLAMFEIVAFHVSEQRLPWIAGLGLPVFLLLNNAFNCTLAARMGGLAFLRVKVGRLLLPWLSWSAIYGAVLSLERLRHAEPLLEGVSAWMLLGGTYDHLWFVPFALFGALAGIALVQLTRRFDARAVVGLSVLAGAAWVLGDAALLAPGTIEWPILQWLFALPSALLGFALGKCLLAQSRRALTLLLGSSTAAAALALWLSPRASVPSMPARYAVSVFLVALGFVWSGRADAFSRRLTPLLFGIYLSHPLILRGYRALHWPEPSVAALALLVFGASALLVAALQRTPFKFLV